MIGTRGITLSTVHCDIFKVQDEEDFKEKVIKSKIPVIVDFYATYVNSKINFLNVRNQVFLVLSM